MFIRPYLKKQVIQFTISHMYLGNRLYHYDEDGRLTRTVIDEYDDKGNHVKQSYYGSDGELESYYTYEYDKDGNMVQQNEYAGDGKLSRYWSY